MSSPRGSLCVLVCALLGCGGEDRGRPTQKPDGALGTDPGSGPIVCDADPKLELLVLDDFELAAAGGNWFTNNEVCEPCQLILNQISDANRAIAVCSVSPAPAGCQDPERQSLIARKPELIAALDRCKSPCVKSQQPSLFDKPLPAEAISGGRCGSRFALHVRGGPFVDGGGSVGLTFSAPFDASAFDGIAFWARRGPLGRNALRVEVSERHTEQKYDKGDGKPICDPVTTEDDTSRGCDKFGGYAVTSDDWRLFLLPFAELRQAGWGLQAPFLDIWGLMSLSFRFDAGNWDFWLDDVSFYRQKS